MSSENNTPKKVWYAPNKFEAYGEEEIKAVEECLRAGWLAPGPLTAKFEEQVAEHFGKKFGVMVNSGSSGNMIALMLADVGPGDEVVTCTLSFATVVAPILQLGATPVFVDAAEGGRYVPEAEQILAAITPKTKCIMVANLVGSKTDWEKIRAGTDLPLIEDSCDTMTNTPCTDFAVISFYASHIITAGGGGGVVMMNTEALRKKALMIRDWGRIGNNSEDVSERFNHDVDGIPYDFKFLYGAVAYNFKSTEMNAAFGLVQMTKLEKFKQIRREHIAHYCERLQGTTYVLPTDHEKYDWLAMPLQTKNRQKLLTFLEDNQVQTRVCFAGNITRHPAFRHLLVEGHEVADRLMAEGFLLGAHHGLATEDIDRVCDLLIQFDNEHNKSE